MTVHQSFIILILILIFFVTQISSRCTSPTQYDARIWSSSPSCTSCPNGYKCDGITIEKCPKGTTSTGNSGLCNSCPAGEYCNGETTGACDPKYYSTGGLAYCLRIPLGLYKSTSSPGSCGNAQYTPNAGDDCRPVSGNEYIIAKRVRNCPPGGYIPNSNKIGFSICPAGSACSGDGGTTSCPGSKILGSVTCPEILTPSLSLPCSGGQYYNAGTQSCTTCPSGSKCETPISSPVSCNAGGEYSDEAGLMFCKQCPVGSYCNGGKKVTIANNKYSSDFTYIF